MTAVEFIVKQLDFLNRERKENLIDAETYFKDKISLVQQANELFEQQIKDAFQYKFFHPYVDNEPEQYYNETYKNETK
jgi:hypothetical protein